MIYTFLDPVKQELAKRLMKNTGSTFFTTTEPREEQRILEKQKKKSVRLQVKSMRAAKRKGTPAPATKPMQNITEVQTKYMPTFDLPADASLVCVQGILRGTGEVINQAIERKVPWMYLDHGYMHKQCRIVIGETAPTIIASGKRFEHNTRLENWKGGHGSEILVLPPSEFYTEQFGLQDFLYDVVNRIAEKTDRKIVVRPKPFNKKAFDLEQQLRTTYCVVTWGSALALESVRRGIPTISTGWCPTIPLSFNFDDLETEKMSQEPDRQKLFDSLTWFCYDQDELHIAYDTVRRIYGK